MVDHPTWLSLSQAAQVLGVHFTTLRRWADQGSIEYIRTPGGKRKFERKAVDEFLERHRKSVHNPVVLARIKDATIVKTREDIQSYGVPSQNWYVQMDETQRMRMRDTGNRLIALLFQYCSRNSNQEIFVDEGKRIAEEYGRFCCSAGMAVSECINTFLLFRRSMLSSIHETGLLHGEGDTEGRLLFERMIVFLDEVLLAMVVEYTRS